MDKVKAAIILPLEDTSPDLLVSMFWKSVDRCESFLEKQISELKKNGCDYIYVVGDSGDENLLKLKNKGIIRIIDYHNLQEANFRDVLKKSLNYIEPVPDSLFILSNSTAVTESVFQMLNSASSSASSGSVICPYLADGKAYPSQFVGILYIPSAASDILDLVRFSDCEDCFDYLLKCCAVKGFISIPFGPDVCMTVKSVSDYLKWKDKFLIKEFIMKEELNNGEE